MGYLCLLYSADQEYYVLMRIKMADEDVCSFPYASCKSSIPPEKDLIRQGYKYYKRKKPPPDFSEVIDFNNPELFQDRIKCKSLQSVIHSNHGLRCSTEWKVFELVSCPGFIFIVNPFLPGVQRYWTRRCIKDFTRKPNVSNLDAHMTINDNESVWDLSREERHHDLMNRLRWVHLGYQFDYNVVDYKPEHYYGFPKDLSVLMNHIAQAIGYQGYTPEAGIVNYYPLGTSMGGHTDHYELDLSWPLLSISFGQSAVFLIGGQTKDIKPTALYIHSGDIVIMSGESRLAYHAVPRIVKTGSEDDPPEDLKWTEQNTYQNTDVKCCISDFKLGDGSYEEWTPFAKYLSKTRINVNVRQVHSLGNTVV